MISRGKDGSVCAGAFESLVMDGERVTLAALVMPTSQAVVDYVASHRNAVGDVSTGVLTDTVRAVPVEGIACGRRGDPVGRVPPGTSDLPLCGTTLSDPKSRPSSTLC